MKHVSQDTGGLGREIIARLKAKAAKEQEPTTYSCHLCHDHPLGLAPFVVRALDLSPDRPEAYRVFWRLCLGPQCARSWRAHGDPLSVCKQAPKWGKCIYCGAHFGESVPETFTGDHPRAKIRITPVEVIHAFDGTEDDPIVRLMSARRRELQSRRTIFDDVPDDL